MKKNLFYIILLISLSASAQKTYQKNYFDNGNLKSEGWTKNNQKNGYWKFYYENRSIEKEGHFSANKPVKYWYFYTENGIKKSEGHFIKGEKTNWWLFYDDKEKIDYKCQLKHNKKNGFCLMYKNEKLISAAKFKAGKKIKEWTDLKAFKKENNLLDLQ
ncbi:toxin-antitoxin system YwqK family antitoxin [Wocania ichthyoenteri]|uniref:toxin-antitoxin system YwqK family antitoxin n=1 Tax=Wocania ichthyoenteri TaxID=1230531 RepID=UPI00053E1956|nr:hypothetical protein [Wocania ichthyoenteri]